MTVLSPRHTAQFEVYGATETELHEQAAKALAKFAAGGTKWDFTIDAYGEIKAVDGTINSWRGEVTAWRTWKREPEVF